MKTNLKKFPKLYERNFSEYYFKTQKWKDAFEKELQEQLIPRVISAMAELVDDRSDFQKGWKIGYVDCLKAVLGDSFNSMQLKTVQNERGE